MWPGSPDAIVWAAEKRPSALSARRRACSRTFHGTRRIPLLALPGIQTLLSRPANGSRSMDGGGFSQSCGWLNSVRLLMSARQLISKEKVRLIIRAGLFISDRRF